MCQQGQLPCLEKCKVQLAHLKTFSLILHWVVLVLLRSFSSSSSFHDKSPSNQSKRIRKQKGDGRRTKTLSPEDLKKVSVRTGDKKLFKPHSSEPSQGLSICLTSAANRCFTLFVLLLQETQMSGFFARIVNHKAARRWNNYKPCSFYFEGCVPLYIFFDTV